MLQPNVEDRLAILELYALYSWALDTGDTEAYLALFTVDAEAIEETSGGEIEVRKGREEIRKLVLKFHERARFPGHQHQMAQFVFDPDPEGRPDHWIVRSYAWATINRPPAPPHLHWCGHVRDVIAREDGVGGSSPRRSWAGRATCCRDSRRGRSRSTWAIPLPAREGQGVGWAANEARCLVRRHLTRANGVFWARRRAHPPPTPPLQGGEP